jgi:LmbE family N-acetylglucosaminyl deacetylase
MRWIFLSPHLDDSILTAGGLIHDLVRAGVPVEVWTFMCGMPTDLRLSEFAKSLHAQWGSGSIQETVALRRNEDQRAAGVLGTKSVHFDFLDAIYRRAPDGTPLYSEVLATGAHPEDAKLPEQICKAMQAALKPEDIVVAQLAIGDHIDHVLVRQAAEMLGRSLKYALDMPYVLLHPEEKGPKTAGLNSSLQAVSEVGVEAWLRAVAEYRSQISMLYETLELLGKAIRGYWAAERGIRLWTQGSNPAEGLDSRLNP